MKKKVKTQYLKLLSENLSLVDSRKKDMFICPTCLNEIKINDFDNISEAHIIPKAAKGTLKTFLCRKCNSRFGTKQDKWFGEIIKIHNDKKQFGEIELEGRYFKFGNNKFHGKWFTKENGNLAYVFYRDRNSPSDYKFFSQYCKNSKINISLEYPILKKENLIKKGYLTAAYLYYFRIFGYSWIFQDHLDSVRNYILDYDSDVTKTHHFISFEKTDWAPWIGLFFIDANIFPAMGLNNLLTILPSYSIKNIEELFKNVDISKSKIGFRVFNYEESYHLIPSQLLTYYDQPIVFPDTIKRGLSKDFMVQLITEEGIKNMRPSSEEGYNKYKNDDRYDIREITIIRT
jgi:hypothetical protein